MTGDCLNIQTTMPQYLKGMGTLESFNTTQILLNFTFMTTFFHIIFKPLFINQPTIWHIVKAAEETSQINQIQELGL
jgi:hypothetical protein